jgi:hypothetical protein
MTVLANGQPLLQDFDVPADSGGDRTAEVKVFPDISPAADGPLHLRFSSVKGDSAMLSAIEILPGIHGQVHPVRIVARDVPYYSNDSHWWSLDAYFKGGQLSTSQEPATEDPEFYETERWGHFSYAIPRCSRQVHRNSAFHRTSRSHGSTRPQERVARRFRSFRGSRIQRLLLQRQDNPGRSEHRRTSRGESPPDPHDQRS